MRLSPNIIEKCTESINESKPDTTNNQSIFSPIGMEIDIDGDTFTRSTSTLTVGSSSNLPLLDMSGDTDLIHRQEAARDTMIKNNISLDREPLARKALVWSNSSVKLQFALYMSRRFFDCQVISLQKIQNL